MGDIPLGLDSCMTVHVTVLGAIEFDTSDYSHLRGKLGGICVSYRRMGQNCEAFISNEEERTRDFDEFAAALHDGKLDPVDHDFVNGG